MNDIQIVIVNSDGSKRDGPILEPQRPVQELIVSYTRWDDFTVKFSALLIL